MLTSFVARRLGWLAGAAALLGLALLHAPDLPAQGKKAAADAPKAVKGKKEAAPAGPVQVDRTKLTAEQEALIVKAIENRPPDQADTTKGSIVDVVTYINQQIEKGWRDNKVMPAARCTDYEFVRRAHLDIIGRIPTPAEIGRFMKDPETRRRSLLIDRLLGYYDEGITNDDDKYGSQYGKNFGNMWTVMLLTRTGSQHTYQDQMRGWLSKQFQGSVLTPPDWSKTVTAILTATGDTNKNAAVNYVLHHLGEEIKQDHAVNGAWDMVPVTSRTTRLFLGVRTQCVQCHDHPFSGDLGQHHFWGINAFFRQVEPSGRPTMMMQKKKKDKNFAQDQQYELKDNPLFNAKGLVPYERRNGILLYTDPTFLDGKKILVRGVSKDMNRREALAKLVTHDPNFAKAFVNRMWGHFMGKSFTKDAVDDFGEHNPVSHPELLDKLAEDWAKQGHNPKLLIRWICNSRAYGLEAKANPYNDRMEDETLFARMLLKPMSPELLFESLLTATAVKLTPEEKEKLREEWLERLVVNFGNDEGEEGNFNGTVVQALLLMNGQDINNAIMDDKNGTVAAILKKDVHSKAGFRQALYDLYLAALSRPPTDREVQHFLHSPQMFALHRLPNGGTNDRNFWTGYYQDIFWALLNSNEFILNH